uniref:Transmembrane protein 121 n=1 Tax=Ciona intestinalis TaxID=7719 RepID=H2XLA1_CIOIN
MEAAAARREQEPRPLTSKLHIVCTTMLIMAGMGLLDGYLVDQNLGSRRTGVFVMLLIGDVCLLLVLRYVALWVGSEVRTSKRGSSMIEWFLFVFVLDIKMYFILESVRKKCSAVDSLIAKKSLTLFQAIVIGGLYLLLVGADHLKHLPDLRSLEEVKMRAFWVVIDLLDILELQSTMWETTQGELPYLVVGFVYFYCYIVLIILPPLALAEMNKGEGETRPHEMLIYLVASLCVVNVGSTAIRCVLLFRHKFANTSTIFIGKNIICLGMK